MKTLLVTGGAGFIGSNFVRLALQDPDIHIINLDLLTYAGNLDSLRDVETNARYMYNTAKNEPLFRSVRATCPEFLSHLSGFRAT